MSGHAGYLKNEHKLDRAIWSDERYFKQVPTQRTGPLNSRV